MNDRTRWEDQRREGQRSGQQGSWESDSSSQSWQQQGRDQGSRNQQGGWNDDYRSQQHQRDFGSANRSDRAWGGSSGQQGGSHAWDDDADQRRRGAGGMAGASGYGWTEQGDAGRQSGGRDWPQTRDWGTGDWGGSDRGSTDWRTRDNWRNPGSQSFASDYGMRDGRNYDERFNREGFGGAGAYSNPTFGRGYGPDYGRGGSDDNGGRSERGFFERAGDEIASWFGSEDAQRRREQDYRGHGPSDYTRSDDRIREDVNDRLTDDPRIDARKISVAVDKGEVTLNGTVGSREAKRRAEDCIDRISGVKHVQNNLRVSSEGSYESRASSSSAYGSTGYGTTPTTGTGTSGVTGGASGSTGGSTTGAAASSANPTTASTSGTSTTASSKDS